MPASGEATEWNEDFSSAGAAGNAAGTGDGAAAACKTDAAGAGRPRESLRWKSPSFTSSSRRSWDTIKSWYFLSSSGPSMGLVSLIVYSVPRPCRFFVVAQLVGRRRGQEHGQNIQTAQ